VFLCKVRVLDTRRLERSSLTPLCVCKSMQGPQPPACAPNGCSHSSHSSKSMQGPQPLACEYLHACPSLPSLSPSLHSLPLFPLSLPSLSPSLPSLPSHPPNSALTCRCERTNLPHLHIFFYVTFSFYVNFFSPAGAKGRNYHICILPSRSEAQA